MFEEAIYDVFYYLKLFYWVSG